MEIDESRYDEEKEDRYWEKYDLSISNSIVKEIT